jgi:hypothetical protein
MSQFDELLSALVGAPAFPGARCRGRHQLFDEPATHEPSEVVAARHAQALGLCSCCPALGRCEDWFNTLPPSKRPAGIVAGELRPSPVGRPRKSNQAPDPFHGQP